MELNEAQGRAKGDILDHHRADPRGSEHVLTGNAGTGKTYLMMEIVRALQDRKGRVAVSAPTHKAVGVIHRKMLEAGLEVDAATIHSILGLKPQPDGEKEILRSTGKDRAHEYDAVIIDEASMVSAELMHHIRQKLRHAFVLFVGDPAQLPPVGEQGSLVFAVASKSHLDKIVRQAEGNPIIAASRILRDLQDDEDMAGVAPFSAKRSGHGAWDWARSAEDGDRGIFQVPPSEVDEWLRYEFTADEFKKHADTTRYICWTNARVAEVNRKIRRWNYGDTATPFVPGEIVICRKPVVVDGNIVFSTNQETTVTAIEPGVEHFHFPALPNGGEKKQAIPELRFTLDVWRMTLGENNTPCMIPRFDLQHKALMDALKAQAFRNSGRWYERFMLGEKITQLQHHYAMTSHVSQGSTFGRVFIDVPDMAKCGYYRRKEMLQLFYVAITRPTHVAGLIGPIPE